MRARRLGGHGQPAKRSAAAQAAVAAVVATGRFRTAAEIGDGSADVSGVRYRPGGLASLLDRLRCAPTVPRPVHEQADLAAAGLSGRRPFGFADELRLGLWGMVRRVWGRRGVNVLRPQHLSSHWRSRFVVVDGRAGRISWCWHERMAATELLGMVRAVQQQTDRTARIWDGAASHRDARVPALGRPLIALPPSSPELNPAERFVQELRRAVAGEPYATLDDNVAAVPRVLVQWDADPERVRSRCGWQGMEDAAQTLPADRDCAA